MRRIILLGVLVAAFFMSPAAPAEDQVSVQDFLQRIRNAGITRSEMETYLTNIESLKRFDPLYGMPNNLFKFRELLQDTAPGTAAADTLGGLIRFHETFGDQNPLAEAVNFAWARKGFFPLMDVPESTPVTLADLRTRLAQGEEAYRNLGTNGPTIMGAGVTREHQANHFIELSVRIQERNANLRILVRLIEQHGSIPFHSFEEIRTAAANLPEHAVVLPVAAAIVPEPSPATAIATEPSPATAIATEPSPAAPLAWNQRCFRSLISVVRRLAGGSILL